MRWFLLLKVPGTKDRIKGGLRSSPTRLLTRVLIPGRATRLVTFEGKYSKSQLLIDSGKPGNTLEGIDSED